MHPLFFSARLLATALSLSALALASAHAESFASSASSAGSASVGSSSDSIKGSSNSSSGDKKVADGNYQVLEITLVPDRPGMRRLRLQQAESTGGPDAGFLLDLPQQALGAQGLAAGDVVSVRNREYGIEFARAQTREAFFLVLNDDWRNELDPHAVSAF